MPPRIEWKEGNVSFTATREKIHGQPNRHCVSVASDGNIFYMQDILASSLDGELAIIQEAMQDRKRRSTRRASHLILPALA
ncbi:hypothetical protein [Deinococcus sp. Leaf326]|uniref:hypothetical protein n=1 Tax=Deinococcus sp. Leaf326 TaxID=1736338 RepID=UPI0012E12E3E|nr:hypothetical protein [Deinococcus sp. Leaf326]